MKVGDKLICKKDIDSFKKDGEYTIGRIYDVNIKFFIIFSSRSSRWFSDNGSFEMMIWDYFYTKKELRKLKLEKIKI